MAEKEKKKEESSEEVKCDYSQCHKRVGQGLVIC